MEEAFGGDLGCHLFFLNLGVVGGMGGGVRGVGSGGRVFIGGGVDGWW